MARAYVLGNGVLTLACDAFGQIVDLSYPHVGLEHHMANSPQRLGIFIDGNFAWFNDPAWKISHSYEDGALVGLTTMRHEALGVRVMIRSTVYNERPVFIRSFEIELERGEPRPFRFFQHVYPRLSEAKYGATAYYDPESQGIVFYRSDRCFLFGGQDLTGHAPTQFAVGECRYNHKEGTWKDAEDGQLSGNAVEHGSVDGTLCHELFSGPGRPAKLDTWLIAGESQSEVIEHLAYIRRKTPAYILQSTRNYWHAWLKTLEVDISPLDEKTQATFKHSLLILRVHTDNGGGIVASVDLSNLQKGKDTYAYVWPRDGTYIAMAFADCNFHEIALRFYAFCAKVLSHDGYLGHKYLSNGSLGSSWHPWYRGGKKELPIQEDETAGVLCGLWEYYQDTKDIEFIEKIYNQAIWPMASFLITHRQSNGLPLPSYDLWEEEWSVSCYTAAVVYGGLQAAGKFARVLGKNKHAIEVENTAVELKTSILEHFFDPAHGTFHRLIKAGGGIDARLDSSTAYALWRYGVLDVSDERLMRHQAVAMKALGVYTVEGQLWGLIRYQGDQYMSENGQANPWIICTLWYAQYLLAQAKDFDQVQKAKTLIDTVTQTASPTLLLAEQHLPGSHDLRSVSPLAWSHGAYIDTVLRYLATLKRIAKS